MGSIGLVKSPGQYAQGCEAQLKMGLYHPVDRVRGRRVLAVDEERGLVMMASSRRLRPCATPVHADGWPQAWRADRHHAMSRELFEVYKVVGGRIEAIQAVCVDQPFGMPVAW